MHTQLTTEDAKRVILAGRATVTFQSLKTGTHYTYKVELPKPGMPYFVSVLGGPDNTRDYHCIGRILAAEPRIFHPSRKVSATAPAVLAFGWVYEHLMQDDLKADKVNIYHEGKCCRCGRKLTTPESIERGIGPECAKHL